jgi:glyoxalase family protein
VPENAADPHAAQPVLSAGADATAAATLVILFHGRGGSADDVIQLARHLPQERVRYLAPSAAGREWYPQRFLAPLETNEPFLSSALRRCEELIHHATTHGFRQNQILLGGFSQGACLALEAAVRSGGRFGGVFALAGALIGPPGAARPHDRDLNGTPVFLGCGDVDPHIPIASVEESARILRGLGAALDLQVYPGLGHTIVPDEIERVAALIQRPA